MWCILVGASNKNKKPLNQNKMTPVEYPFRQGETYYFISDQEHIIEAVWDYIAETLYNDKRMYFKSYKEAHNYLLKNY